MRIVGVDLLVGELGTLLATRIMRAILYDVEPHDPVRKSGRETS
ncbi:MAG: hypothetical protein SFU84_12665 [Gemmatimonadales bacterium]|nr:hypothetical protein [Gemmatimonadales bacterium]